MSTVKADYLVNAAGTGAPTFTNGAVLPAGSAAAPAISPTGDSNTGIFFPAADTIAFSEGGAEAMRIDSSGNVGIGTSSPDGKIDIQMSSMDVVAGLGGNYPMWTYRNGSGSWFHAGKSPSADAFVITTGATPVTTEYMRIDAAGNVGIGTSSVSYQLTVAGLGQETSALTDAGNKGGSLYLRATAVAANSGGAVLFGTTFGNQTPFAAVKGLVQNGGTNTVGDLAFSTRNAVADTSLTERFRISYFGGFGIGGANYGTSGQVMISGGASAAPSWASSQSIGVGQTWQNVGASRARNTDYVNSTGRPILVNVSYTQTSSTNSAVLVDGLTVASGSQNSTATGQLLSAIVPNGSTYRANLGTNGFSFWAELR